MFGTGFELLLILIVALLVVGPERLPKVARQAGLWVGRARTMVQSLRAQFEEEIELDELKRDTENLRRDAQSLKAQLGQAGTQTETGLRKISKVLSQPVSEWTATEKSDPKRSGVITDGTEIKPGDVARSATISDGDDSPAPSSVSLPEKEATKP
jgi:sec-independent protein translocase protein TatB